MKTELKNLSHNSHTIALSKGTIFAKKAHFFQKNADMRKIKKVLVLKGIFPKNTYVCEPLKSPPRLGLKSYKKQKYIIKNFI